MTSTESKPSTGSDTGSGKTSLRNLLTTAQTGHIMDMYWGGPERRITGLTLRIISVNAVALIILVIGILYLGRYQGSLIETKLEAFQGDIEMIAASINREALDNAEQTVSNIARTRAFSNIETGKKRLAMFSDSGNVIADTASEDIQIQWRNGSRPELQSIQTLKAMASFVLRLAPQQRPLPPYPDQDMLNPSVTPDVAEALNGRLSLSVWLEKPDTGRILLSAAAPVMIGDEVAGAVLMTRDGRDIEREVNQVWVDVVRIFLGSLVITILLSIYLSGVIGQPLRKLAKAAEAVRMGNGGPSDIPDFSDRNDEIGELSVVIRNMTRALSERLDTIESFAADVAHELKNPLTSLKSAVETATRVKKETDRQKLMEVVRHDIDRMDRLITDISAASRLDTELSREVFHVVDLKALLHHVLDRYEDPLQRVGDNYGAQTRRSVNIEKAEIILNVPVGHVLTVGIESRLIQVFENILANALSFAPEGSTVEISLKQDNKTVRITIEDEGPGIPETKLESIFERFYSERPDYEDYGNHSGLGLSICRQIIAAHRGTIRAENIIDEDKIKGARFIVTLNRVDAP